MGATTVLTAEAASSTIDITFKGSGEATTVQSVTVTNLTHTDIAPVTLSGSYILRLAYTSSSSDLKGDLNGDGNVDAADITACVGAIAGNPTYQKNADVNGDKVINIADVLCITNIINGSTASARAAGDWSFQKASKKVKKMKFNEGDVLRFEGTSGEMRTIVVNAPKQDHTISFCFYSCKDASGNTYPIIEAGGLLWMAEDLKCMKGISVQSQAARYADAARNGGMNLALKMSNDDIYYTYSAAKKALPEGWSLPTLGELDAFVKKLGGYDEAGDKMQRAGDHPLSFPSKIGDLPDSLQLSINAMGYVGEDGITTDYSSGYIMTGTRENGEAICMRITDGYKQGFITTKDGNGKDVPLTLKRCQAVHVRGVRPAPSPYTDMMVALCGKTAGAREATRAEADGSAEKNPWTGEVNPYTGTPYGAYYTVDNSMKWIFADIKGQHFVYDQNFANANRGIYRYDDTQFSQMAEADSWEKDDNGRFLNITRLKKMCAQKMADGTFHTLRVSFDQSVRAPEVDNAWNNKYMQWLARDIENRPGSLILQEYGNQEQGFALQKTITLPGTYTMVEVYGSEKSFSDNSGNLWYTENNGQYGDEISLNEFYMKRLNLLAADFNQDGTDDIVVGFCDKWMVLDGRDYTTVLAKRTFPTDCVRACVGDLDENGYTDLGFIYQYNNQINVRVLMDDVSKMDETQNPDINVAASYAATLPVAKDDITSFLDIKFGDITNTGNSVLCLVVPFAESLKSTFYVLDRGVGNMLNQTYKLDEQSSVVRSVRRDLDEGAIYKHTCNYPNSTIAVVHTRGLGERPDVLLHGGLYRLDNSNKFVPVQIEGVKNNQIIDAVIPSDCVAVGRFTADLPDGYEQLAYLGHYYTSIETAMFFGSGSGKFVQGCAASVCSNLLTPVPSNGTMKRKAGNAKASVNIGVFEPYIFSPMDGPKLRLCAYFPAFCAPSYSDLDVRRFKLVSCQATMTEPRIKYMLAAAPYYKGYEYTNGPSTGWAKATSETIAEGHSNGTKASLIFGYEQENKISVFGIEIGKFGFEFETEISHEWEKSVNTATTFTWESGCSTDEDDVVGLSMTPVWLYTYECIDSNNPDNIGEKLVCGAPSTPRDLSITLTDYMKLRGDRDEIPDLSTVFTHTPGYPFTYIDNPDDLERMGRGHIWSNNNKNQYMSTGSGSTNSLSISMTGSVEEETTNTFSLEMSLVGFVGALNNTVKAGVGAGYTHTWSTSYTTEKGTTVSGSVPTPKQLGGVPMFNWNLCRYVMNVGGQEFPVVNYVVTH